MLDTGPEFYMPVKQNTLRSRSQSENNYDNVFGLYSLSMPLKFDLMV